MAQAATSSATSRFAVVTGANKGIGFDICKQLASNGITVILTARNVKRGNEALQKLKGFGLSNLVLFHQLDVIDPASVAFLAEFIKSKFGRLDILVNNAAISGVLMDSDAVRAAVIAAGGPSIKWNDVSTRSYDMAEECLKVNYYGAKMLIEELLPLLKLSDSARIVNVSSSTGKLKFIINDWAKEVLSDVENLTEERVKMVLNEFLKDFKEGFIETKGWPTYFSAYTMSKAAMNAYTRIHAKKHPSIIINSVCPGYVKTSLNCFTGTLTAEEGAKSPVRLALWPNGGPSGMFFYQKEISPF